jgi:hypothetical protein
MYEILKGHFHTKNYEIIPINYRLGPKLGTPPIL